MQQITRSEQERYEVLGALAPRAPGRRTSSNRLDYNATMEQFFPNGIEPYLVGGLVMGLAVSFAFAMSGLVTGMSTVFSSSRPAVGGWRSPSASCSAAGCFS